MNLFFKRSTLFLAVLIPLGLAADFVLAEAYLRMKSGRDAQTTYVITRARDEAIVVGTSRASHHYIPEILARKWNLSVYNAGRDGMSLPYCEGIVSSVIRRYRPRLIILDIWEEDLLAKKGEKGRLSVFAPYLRWNESLRDIIRSDGKYSYLACNIPVFRFNSKLVPILVNNFLSRGGTGDGYVPLHESMSGAPLKDGPVYDSVDVDKLRSLRNIVEMCRRGNVQLVAVKSPVFNRSVENRNRLVIKELFEENGMAFLDLSQVPELLEGRYFKDGTHLNHPGALAFTEILSNAISVGERP